jgi:phosphate transport system substrate-binding protein
MVPTVRRMRNKTMKLASLALAAGLVLSACGDDDDTGTDTSEEGSDAGSDGELSEGSINISGSSTVEPISAIVADEFNAVGSNAQISVEGPGTGDGFERFCAGEIEIADASRPIDEEEIAACDEAGIEFVELEVAFDGLTVLTSAENDAVECISFNDLYALMGPESDDFSNWSDAQDLATELGSDTQFPDAELVITAPGQESGTYDAFIELALADPAEARVAAGAITEDQAETTRPDYSSQADDNAIIQGIEGSDTSFGWVGFAFAEEAGDSVREIAISEEPGGECVEPSAETIADGSYPLSRPLFIYVNAVNVDENPAVAEYVDYYLGDGYSAVEEVGYVPLPDDQLEETRSRWEARETGASAG